MIAIDCLSIQGWDIEFTFSMRRAGRASSINITNNVGGCV